MAGAKPKSDPAEAHVVLICGDEEFSVAQRAKQIVQSWTSAEAPPETEIIDAQVSNSDAALKVLASLRAALQTLPFFNPSKVIWVQNCNFLGEERTASTQAVTENLADLAGELSKFSWENVRLLITAGKVDKRKVFYKTIDKIGAVEIHEAWSMEDRDWMQKVEGWLDNAFEQAGKSISSEARSQMALWLGPNIRLLQMEVEKLCLFAGDRQKINIADVETITTRSKHARAFALSEAVGDRKLGRALERLDEEMWELRQGSQKSELGLLYGLISKMRTLLLTKALLKEKLVSVDRDYGRFAAQVKQIPAEKMPSDRRFNPAQINPYMLFKALPQTANYSMKELASALEVLLECNQQLFYSSLDGQLVLEQALMKIIGGDSPQNAKAR